MKVVLVHGKYFNSWEALGLGYIGAAVKAEMRNEVDVSFYQGCFDDDETILAASVGADIVAFSCTTPTFPHSVQLARRIKRESPGTHIVVGGYHPSAVRTEALVDGIDQVVVGEGEAAMLSIMRGNREPVVSGARLMALHDTPWPDRALIKCERNIAVAQADTGMRITSFQSHRSCPFRCKYCLDGHNKVLYGLQKNVPVAYRNVDDLLSEIEWVTEKHRLDLIKFSDPTWNTSVDWVLEFCRRKIARGIKVPFYPNLHAGLVTREMTDLMKEAECYEVALGIESGSPKVLKEIGKGTSVNSIRRGIGHAKASGIICRGYFILGMPNETEDDLRATERLAEELELDEYGFSILCPYPGTVMYDREKHADVDWEKADEYGNDFWSTEHLSNDQLHQWQQYLCDKFSDKVCWHNREIMSNESAALPA